MLTNDEIEARLRLARAPLPLPRIVQSAYVGAGGSFGARRNDDADLLGGERPQIVSDRGLLAGGGGVFYSARVSQR